VREIGALKQAQGGLRRGSFRPARETQILRGLIARSKGELSPLAILAIWREIFGAALRSQALPALHLFGGVDRDAMRDLARGAFGTSAPLVMHDRASLVLHECAEDPTALGIVPIPGADEGANIWWAQLAPSGTAGPRIAARLPLVDTGAAQQADALVLATLEQEPSGDDVSLVLIEAEEDVSRAKLGAILKKAGIEGQVAASAAAGPNQPPRFYLLETAAFLDGTDPRLAAITAASGGALARAVQIGGYPRPISLDPVQLAGRA